MTSKLSAVQVQEITQQLAQLYVDSNVTEIVTRYEAITGKTVTHMEKHKLREQALDEFNAWTEAQKNNG